MIQTQMAGDGRDARSRIIAAATELYARSGKFPSVAAVRHAAQVDMNAASAVMREWRRERQQPLAVAAVPLPEPVLQMSNAALTSVWNSAVEIAGEALRNAQVAWADERSQVEQHLQQVIDAYDGQTADMAEVRRALREAEEKLVAASTQTQQLMARLAHSELQHTQHLADRDKALMEAARAREECAHMSGQLETLFRQNTELLSRLNSREIPPVVVDS
jgi:hypothetical protein